MILPVTSIAIGHVRVAMMFGRKDEEEKVEGLFTRDKDARLSCLSGLRSE